MQQMLTDFCFTFFPALIETQEQDDDMEDLLYE